MTVVETLNGQNRCCDEIRKMGTHYGDLKARRRELRDSLYFFHNILMI